MTGKLGEREQEEGKQQMAWGGILTHVLYDIWAAVQPKPPV